MRHQHVQPNSGEPACQIDHDKAQTARGEFDGCADCCEEQHVAQQVEEVRVQEQRREHACRRRMSGIEAELEQQVRLPHENERGRDIREDDRDGGYGKAAASAQASCNASSVMSTFT